MSKDFRRTPAVLPPASPVPAPSVVKEIPKDPPYAPCRITQQPDGGAQVLFLMDANMTERLRKKAYQIPLEKFLWENVIRPALENTAY